MFYDFLYRHFITLFLIAGFSMKLAMLQKTKDLEVRYLWMTAGCMLVLVVADFLEVLASQNERWRFFRILFSVIGYSVRPLAALSILMVVADRWASRLLWVPPLVNILIMCTAFFSPIAFSYDENYEFVRGPLGYSVFVIGFLYIVLILWYTRRRFRKDRSWERRVLYLCGVSTILAALIDVAGGGEHLNEAILISALFYYIFIRSQDINRDALTGLMNRHSFYEDIELYQSQITAVASLDMNGLKQLNDTKGHGAGDQALIQIGQCMLDAADKSIIPYRMGGDEFAILFLKKDEDKVRDTLEKVRSAVQEAGLSVSAGYAMRENRENLNDLYTRSDQKMYEDKAAYYSAPGRSRRRRRDGPRDAPPASENPV